jgi:hypothetical protein
MALFGRKTKYEIGVLFDIDALGSSSYGQQAYRIVFASLDPHRITRSLVYDGDTNATIAGIERSYCIAFQVSSRPQLDYIRDTMAGRTDPGLRPAHCRFLEGQVIKREPLVSSGAVNPDGIFAIWENDLVQPSWAEGTAWRIGFIPPP